MGYIGRMGEMGRHSGRVGMQSLLLLLFVGGGMLCSQTLRGQSGEEEESSVEVRGQASLTADFYSAESVENSLFESRRPATLVRFLFTPVITAGDFSLPFTLLLSSEQTNVTTPSVPNPSLSQFLQNRANRLTFSPEYKWARLDLGTWTPRYSNMTTGNQALFGAGFDLTPGPLRLAFFYGSAQAAIEPDSATGVTGAFARESMTGRISVGDEEKTEFGLNMVRVKDDTASIAPQSAGGLVPEEGMTLSADVKMKIAEKLTVEGEFAGSAYSRNLRSAEIEDSEIASTFITLRESTRLDYGGRLGVAWNEPLWGASLVGRYLGDGFVPLGYPYAQSDLAEVTLSPRASLLENRLQLNGSLGYRVNNLQNTSAASTNQLIGTISGTGRIGTNLTLSGSYANAGFESILDRDTLKIRTVTESFSFTPMYTLRDANATHAIALSLNLSDFVEENTLTSLASINDMFSLTGTWSVALRKTPLKGTLSTTYTRNNLPLGVLTILSSSLRASLRLMKGDLTPSLRFSYSQNGIGESDPDNRFGVKGGVSWKVMERLTLQTEGSVVRHQYGDLRPGASYTELLLRTGISTQF